MRKLHTDGLLFGLVQYLLRQHWSPEQIALVLARIYPKGHEYRVSHETIYNCLIKGAGNASAVGTLVERTSRLLILVKLPHPKSASAANVLQAFTDKLNGIAAPMRLSLTYDQGREMSMHKKLTEQTGVAVYFCDLHGPWQRGSSENTNGLVRQYLPKGTDLSGYSQEQLDAIVDEINGRPRKGLAGYDHHWRFIGSCS